MGRSRGGLTSKVTALTDAQGRIVRFTLKPGNTHEIKELVPLLEEIQVTGQLLADKAYDSHKIREWLAEAGIKAVIPPQRKQNRKKPEPYCDMEAYKARHLVENAFADIKQFRGVATRYCKLAVTYCELLSLVCWVVNTRPTRRGASPYLR